MQDKSAEFMVQLDRIKEMFNRKVVHYAPDQDPIENFYGAAPVVTGFESALAYCMGLPAKHNHGMWKLLRAHDRDLAGYIEGGGNGAMREFLTDQAVYALIALIILEREVS